MRHPDFARYLTDYPNYIHHVRIRILEKCVENERGCLEYRSGKLKHKYGLTSITLKGIRKSVPVHRAVWMAANGRLDLPREVQIRHKCDNPCCCNIEHLKEGTALDNSKDMYERGRQRKKETYKPHTRVCRFTDDEIRAIRAEPGKIKHVAAKFKTTASYVSKIKSGYSKALVV